MQAVAIHIDHNPQGFGNIERPFGAFFIDFKLQTLYNKITL
jgi:hypothetical protein